MRVLITRTPDAAAQLINQLRGGAERAGIELEIACAPVHQAVALLENATQSALGQLSNYDWVTFTSANGVLGASRVARYFVDRCSGCHTDSEDAGALSELLLAAGCKVAAVGSATKAALESLGVSVDFVPSVADANHMVAEFPAAGSQVLCLQGTNARPTLAEGLNNLGCRVRIENVYEMRPYPALNPLVPTGEVPASDNPAHLPVLSTEDARNQLPSVDALIATAPSLLNSLTCDLPVDTLPPVVAIGATTARAAKHAGARVLTSASPQPADLAAATLDVLTNTKEEHRASS